MLKQKESEDPKECDDLNQNQNINNIQGDNSIATITNIIINNNEVLKKEVLLLQREIPFVKSKKFVDREGTYSWNSLLSKTKQDGVKFETFLPYNPDPNFIDREGNYSLKAIFEQLSNNRITIINGVSGVGKSTLSTELAYIWKDSDDKRISYWVQSESFEGFKNATKSICRKINIDYEANEKLSYHMVITEIISRVF